MEFYESLQTRRCPGMPIDPTLAFADPRIHPKYCAEPWMAKNILLDLDSKSVTDSLQALGLGINRRYVADHHEIGTAL